ncbi:unnamed protein product [Thlaspi arvense]|uniref:Uncharacterized protein n=1 Tax=Thlaspi arvense TaxID=13288 RepID=A0AAU9RV73_THLAR|nr:unnamed protein product [Thlaspi arvense]
MAPLLTCVLLVKTGLQGWEKVLTKIFQGIEGLTMNMEEVPYWMLQNLQCEVGFSLTYVGGEVDPLIFIKKLYKARDFTMLYRMDYGYEENPDETRKPNNQFMRCIFTLDTLEEGWDKRMIGALKPVQGVSFTIDQIAQMVYLCGNIEFGILMKTVGKTGIHLLAMEYGVECKDPNLKPPAKTLEAPPPPPPPASESKAAQPTKDTVPPTRPEDVTCILLVKTGQGWEKVLTKIFQGIEGLTISIKQAPYWMLRNLQCEDDFSFTYLRGEVDPLIFIKRLYKARDFTMLFRLVYGYEEPPEETNNQFMRYCEFMLDTLEEGWDKRMIGVLKPLQGVSFIIDAETQTVSLKGNIEFGVLMKTLGKTGIRPLNMDYGVDPNLKPPAKTLEAPPPPPPPPASE